MNPDEYINFENRYYQNPTLTRDETLSFVDSLRDTVQKDNASIAEQTQSLGTDVPSNLGGLTGSQGYFTQRYQTTPMEYQANALKATAQADALNKLMDNYKNQAANRYKQAYRNARNSAGGNGGGGGDGVTGGVEYDPTDDEPLTKDDNEIVLQEPYSNTADVISNSVLYGGNPGNTQYGTSVTPYYYVLNGDTTSFTLNKTFWGSGIETPTRSYGTKDAAREYLQDIIKRGGKIYNQYGKDITWNAIGSMGLY